MNCTLIYTKLNEKSLNVSNFNQRISTFLNQKLYLGHHVECAVFSKLDHKLVANNITHGTIAYEYCSISVLRVLYLRYLIFRDVLKFQFFFTFYMINFFDEKQIKINFQAFTIKASLYSWFVSTSFAIEIIVLCIIKLIFPNLQYTSIFAFVRVSGILGGSVGQVDSIQKTYIFFFQFLQFYLSVIRFKDIKFKLI